MTQHYDVLIVGGGSAGISIAARLCQAETPPTVGIVEPSDKHYYQPIWTLVGAGIFDKKISERNERDFIPRGADWIHAKVASFEPDENAITTDGGDKITYGDLVVALGIQIDWDKIEGLKDAVGKDGVVSNYSYATVDSTARAIDAFGGGRAIFTFPNTPIKCAGAPQKIMYLAEEQFRDRGIRNKSEVVFASAGANIFGVAKYRHALERILDERDIVGKWGHNLVAIRAASKEAVFHCDGNETVMKYDMIHVTPPQSSPDVIKTSALANGAGWVDVDKHTLQHVRYDNVWSAGDCSSLPCSKTGAAIRKQVPVLVENLQAKRRSVELTGKYDGYASCPLVTGRGTVMLAEFGYDGVIMETFPFDQAEERFSMYALKAYALPQLYWHGMLKGRM